MSFRKIFLFLFFVGFLVIAYSQSFLENSFYEDLPFYLNQEQVKWTEDEYKKMSLDEKVGQLFVVAAYSNQGDEHTKEILSLIKTEKIGGLIFMQGTVEKQLELTRIFQEAAKVPLLISMDAEWGAGMRLDQVKDLPWPIALGALQENKWVYDYGKEIARQLKILGVQMNFGPVVDVNTNPNNPIIGSRSFGSNINKVSAKAIQYAKGLQDAGVLSCAKHFPGHGDTSQDSHKTLPMINHSLQKLETVDLVPFQRMIDAKVSAIMIAHLNVPSLEKLPNTPSSLSKKIVTDLLKEKMGFKGLIITDALNMSGVTLSDEKGMVDYKAFLAGNDVLLFSQAVNIGKEKIKSAIEKGEISMERLEESVKKILMAKYAAGLHQKRKKEEIKNHLDSINNEQSDFLRLKIAENSITMLKDSNNLLPLTELYNKKIAYINWDKDNGDVFYKQLKKFANVSIVQVNSIDQIKNLNGFDFAIVGIHKNNSSPFVSSAIDPNIKLISQQIAAKIPTVLCLFGSPYGLRNFDLTHFRSVLVGYQNSFELQFKMPEIIFGSASVNGILPVEISPILKEGTGITQSSNHVLGYAFPTEVGVSSSKLNTIDEIAIEAIKDKVAPGMQILAARKGKIFYEKYFGNTMYELNDTITDNHIYDVASVTKVISTLPMIIKAVDEGLINIEDSIGKHLPNTLGTNKGGLTIKNILGHQSGLLDWIPFYKETVDERNAKPYLDYYRRKTEKDFSIEIENNLYLINTFRDTIYKRIYDSPIGEKKYRYSDLGFYFLKDIVEKIYKQKLDVLVENYFYKPLNMAHTTYNPLAKFRLEQIVPTENDKYFRNRLVHGKVHDQGAAFFDGVGGHAGVFSNAKDMAVIMQMYLNGGFYGGKQFLKQENLDLFTQYNFLENNNRRGLGFDKQQLEKSGPTCNCTTYKSFGHQGFTGTMVWADPGKDLVFVFLSNRVYPQADNNKSIQKTSVLEFKRPFITQLLTKISIHKTFIMLIYIKNMYQKIKDRLGIESDKKMFLVLLTFTLTGSTIAFALKPIIFFLLGVTDDTKTWKKLMYWVLFVFPSYYLFLLFYGTLLGQKDFFWERIAKRFGKKTSQTKE